MDTNKDKLIYDLIFSEILDFHIDVSEYIVDIYTYDRFIDDIKKILKKSKVSIIKEKINVDTKTVTWDLKVKK
jgi:hypothetical protein